MSAPLLILRPRSDSIDPIVLAALISSISPRYAAGTSVKHVDLAELEVPCPDADMTRWLKKALGALGQQRRQATAAVQATDELRTPSAWGSARKHSSSTSGRLMRRGDDHTAAHHGPVCWPAITQLDDRQVPGVRRNSAYHRESARRSTSHPARWHTVGISRTGRQTQRRPDRPKADHTGFQPPIGTSGKLIMRCHARRET